MAISTLTETCRTALFSLGRELAAWKPSRERAIFGTQAMLSVALAVALARALHLSDTWWAAISGFAVMQTSFSGSMQRAAHRIIGTVIGAALGTLLGPWIGDRPWIFVPVLGAIGGVAIYQANASKAAYAWVLGGVTALMVTYEAHRFASVQATASFAALRVSEVAVGTFACLLIATVFYFGAMWFAKRLASRSLASESDISRSADEPEDLAALIPATPVPSSRQTRVLLGLEGALAIAILASLNYVFLLPGFAQAMVTAIAVLILPAGLASDITRQPVMEKMVQRVAGCLLAGVLGVALIPLMQGEAALCMLALSLGVWVGCHVQTGREGASYVGRQFTIAFIMVFVQDHHWSADPIPALMRLSGILTGIVVLGIAMLAVDRLALTPTAEQLNH